MLTFLNAHVDFYGLGCQDKQRPCNQAAKDCYPRKHYQDQPGKLSAIIDYIQLFFELDRDYDVMSADAIDHPAMAAKIGYSQVELSQVRHIVKDSPLPAVRHSKSLTGMIRAREVPHF